RTRLLGALFSSSSVATGAAATALALALTDGGDSPAIRKLGKIERLASLLEAVAFIGYLLQSGRSGARLLKGKQGRQLLLAAAGAALPRLLPAPKSSEKRKRGVLSTVVGSLIVLAGGFALKWAITHAGRGSSEDPKEARQATRPTVSAPGWGPE